MKLLYIFIFIFSAVILYLYFKKDQEFFELYCPNCNKNNWMGQRKCYNCNNCGWCINQDNYGSCQEGDRYGPFYKKNCKNWFYKGMCMWGPQCNSTVSIPYQEAYPRYILRRNRLFVDQPMIIYKPRRYRRFRKYRKFI